MPRRLLHPCFLLALLTIQPAVCLAQDEPAKIPPTQPAVLDLLMPAGATVAVDGKELGETRSVTIDKIKPDEYRRVKLAVKYPDGSQDTCAVDVVAGQKLTVPLPEPGPEKLMLAANQMLTPIQSAAWSRDGRIIAVCMETVIVLWDTSVGRPVRTLRGHQKAVVAAAFDPEGKRLLTGSADMTAILWDPITGTALRTYQGHTGAVSSVAFSPDGKQILTGSADRTAMVWKIDSSEQIQTLKGHTREIMAVAYGPDGSTVATASADRTGAIWEAATGKRTFVLRGHREEVDAIAFSPDGRQAASGSYDDTGILWDPKTGKRIRSVRHPNDIYSVRFTPDGRRLVTGERDELVIVWDVATGQKVWTLPGHTGAIVSEIISPDGRKLLTASRDGTARLWDLATGQEILTLSTDPTRKHWAVASANGLFDASGPGRQMLGLRLPKTLAGSLDEFFDEYYRPGLLAEVCQGQWPTPQKPLGRSKPPRLKIVSPKARTTPTQEMTFTVDASDQGGGVAPLVVEQNGIRIGVPIRSQPGPDPRTARTSFTVALAPGSNIIRAKAAGVDRTWETATTDFELVLPRAPEHRTRMYVVAVGISSYAEKGLELGFPAQDVQTLAALLKRHSGKLYDRVDVIPVLDRDATRAIIVDTVRDVAELTRPQDTLVVLLSGQGALLGDQIYFAPQDLKVDNDHLGEALRARGVPVNDLAEALRGARALKRVLIMDTAASGARFSGALKGHAEFALQSAVERLARSNGIYPLAAFAPTARTGECKELGHGILSAALLAAVKEPGSGPRDGKPLEPTGAIDVADWFQSATEQAVALAKKCTGESLDVSYSIPAKGFPIVMSQD